VLTPAYLLASWRAVLFHLTSLAVHGAALCTNAAPGYAVFAIHLLTPLAAAELGNAVRTEGSAYHMAVYFGEVLFSVRGRDSEHSGGIGHCHHRRRERAWDMAVTVLHVPEEGS
jgi:hypothetical protein